MKRTVVIAALLALTSCAILQKPTVVNLKPMPVADFLDNPFGHDESIKAFQKSLPQGTKVQKLLRQSVSRNQSPDTIYNFKFKKSKVVIYKTKFNQEYLLGGVIYNPEIEMINGIRQGMTKDKFYEAFTDQELAKGDTIEIVHPRKDRKFNFYFDQRGRLNKFSFSGNS